MYRRFVRLCLTPSLFNNNYSYQQQQQRKQIIRLNSEKREFFSINRKNVVFTIPRAFFKFFLVFSFGGTLYFLNQRLRNKREQEKQQGILDDPEDYFDGLDARKLTVREKRFLRFASVKYEGVPYMTPLDFIEAVTVDRPRPRVGRRIVNEREVRRMLRNTPETKDNSKYFFRELEDNGLISYTEYLFLLTILTKPRSGFSIAFKMFDVDGNNIVDKGEFLILERVMGAGIAESRERRQVAVKEAYKKTDSTGEVGSGIDDAASLMMNKQVPLIQDGGLKMKMNRQGEMIETDKMNEEKEEKVKSDYQTKIAENQEESKSFLLQIYFKIRKYLEEKNSLFQLIRNEKLDEKKRKTTNFNLDRKNLLSLVDIAEQAQERTKIIDTTLLYHFFGVDGNSSLKYSHFETFINNLQEEILDIEFHEFSKGKVTISELEFAEILLRYTDVEDSVRESIKERLSTTITYSKGITFDEFRQFCFIINNIDDFATAIRLFSHVDRPISPNEFQRAAKITTGSYLDDHFVNIIFKIFDYEDEGHLNQDDFIRTMKNRLKRGFRSKIKENLEGWEGFRKCLYYTTRRTSS
ncbi:hypothetical protein SNEBB_009731 [Seison nebaliae]|nr:hypothetical protein SNEBB_009731 [Seison nebaliae]